MKIMMSEKGRLPEKISGSRFFALRGGIQHTCTTRVTKNLHGFYIPEVIDFT